MTEKVDRFRRAARETRLKAARAETAELRTAWLEAAQAWEELALERARALTLQRVKT